MIPFSHIRAGLISTALLLTTALASPALAETLPEISPRQIAQDVDVRYNTQTGMQEYVAPSFDPFEEDRNMAGNASLRSVSSATSIDGQSIRGGALLDLTFYYNSASHDPYDTRGYEEAAFLSGEYASVTRRDNRILECNEQVQDVVYYHEDYYRSSIYVNLFRPYRHYSGHYGYDRFWGRGYARSYGYGNGYRGNRGYRGARRYGQGQNGHSRRDSRNRRSSTTDQLIDRTVERARRTTTQREDRAATGRRLDRTPSARSSTRENRRETRRETRRNPSRDRIDTSYGGRDGFMGGPRRLGSRAGAPGRRSSSTPTRSSSATTARTRNNELAGAVVRRAAPRQERVVRRERAPRVAPRAAPQVTAPAPRVQRAAPAPRTIKRAAPAPRRERVERPKPRRAERAVNRARTIRSNNRPRRSGGKRGSKLKMIGFLPMASSWSRNVVRNVDVQCAREETLTVHIPQDRLDASRFDGLTVLVLDRTGQEIPVYVPPNYIEGFRQAVGGAVRPSTTYKTPQPSLPITRGPTYLQPRPYAPNTASCPAGTTKQSDGTCLQNGTTSYSGYPQY